ncbi:MAG: amidinotransferase [Elusimicrobia bacterium]|nr:amidinotransferase [Elusimicrobiota bacterium]
MNQTIANKSEFERYSPDSFPVMPAPAYIAMCPPDYFDVVDVKNPFMEGRLGSVNRSLARSQWDALRAVFERLGKPVRIIPARSGLEDMVFCANQSLPGLDAYGRKVAVAGRMTHASRQREVSAVKEFMTNEGYRVIDIEPPMRFEGTGDALWHPGRRLLWGGWGKRSQTEAYQFISKTFECPVMTLELVDDRFYHLDTCLCLLRSDAAFFYPGAFTAQGISLLESAFDTLIEAPVHEALDGLACNAVSLDGRMVVLQRGLSKVKRELQRIGFEVIEVETSEFMKSGGSCFCMKLFLF